MSDFDFITEFDAKYYTAAEDCEAVFGWPRVVSSYTIHHYGLPRNYDYKGAWRNVCKYLASANVRRVSAHEVGEAGRVACLIDYADAAWANGDGRGNAQTIAGEWHPRASRKDKKTLARRIAKLWAFYGVLPVHGHDYWTSTSCPGAYKPHKIQRMARRVKLTADEVEEIEKETGGKVKPKPAAKPKRQKRAPKRGLYFTIERGDTLGKVAAYYAVTVAELVRHNKIKNPNVVHVGQHIRIPGPLFWRVEPGDTAGKIAAHYGVSVDVLAVNAGLSDPNLIYPGQLLRII